ncbi:hypothetical protein ACELLULO517_08950 [Acidisoma cellulosilytica]|uniref:Lipoprotein n=1 Tax=Acidisoma cellulosilyticum TaxID=2802395 RepID=A0A963Z0N3_9PROT|nr:hypothetical protein [Acidisoma cellulosilyticum]MCB8880359.1 hypothetical protein [Acidisoma cellulosilyticum]
MSKSTLIRLGAGALIALALGGCYYPYGPGGYYHGGYGGGYGGPHYGYYR